jgi:hypothetical protein
MFLRQQVSQFLTVFNPQGNHYSVAARNIRKKYLQSIEGDDSGLVESDEMENLLNWAQCFSNIDSNRNQIIEQDEFREYVKEKYSSPIFTKKDAREVLTVAMRHFKAAVQENDNEKCGDDVGGLDFKHFVKMMQELQKQKKEDHPDFGEADFKFYEFLKKNAKYVATSARDDDSSDKYAKIIEKAAGLIVGHYSSSTS